MLLAFDVVKPLLIKRLLALSRDFVLFVRESKTPFSNASKSFVTDDKIFGISFFFVS